MKKFTAIVLTIALLVSFTTTALAADPPLTYSSVPTSGTPANGSVGSAQGARTSFGMSPMAVGDIHVYIWRNSITEISSGYLKLFGLTQTDLNADRVDLNFTLQQWNGSDWVTYSTSNNYDTDTSYLSLNIYRYVAHGYYYRVKTVHNGYLNTSSDTETLYSSYIYVS